MTNKYRQVEPLEPGEPSARPVQMGMDGGFRGDISPRQMAPNQTPELSDVRFERTAIRKDFGWVPVGADAAFPVIGLIEHKYIDAQLQFHRLVRFYINVGGNIALEVWDGVNWVLTDTSTEIVASAYLSMISALGCLYAANGEYVFEWCEELQKFPQENDFPASNSILIVGNSVSATVTPGDPVALDYAINYDVEIASSPLSDTLLTLEFLHGAVVLGEVQYFADTLSAFPVQFNNESFQFTRIIPNLDVVSIRVKSMEGGGIATQNDQLQTAGGVGEPEFVQSKGDPNPAVDDKYSFFLSSEGITAGCQVEIGLYYDPTGGGFTLLSTVFLDDVTPNATVVFNLPGLGAGVRWGITRESISGGGCVLPGDAPLDATTRVFWTRPIPDFTVHGHNKAVNLDDPAGVTYETTGGVISVFQPINPGPGGRFITFFARRLVVLRNYGDSQALAWSVDGILDDFTGVGSGEAVLVESRSDPVDDLMGTAVLGSNFMALFRRRSIMRVFETGNSLLALGVVSWIENLGTNYPFSIRNVRGGVIFLGHDNMVYFLTEQGETAIGEPIHQELVETLTGDLSLVDSGWDPTFGDYYLGIPEGAATTITLTWIFDVDRFLNKQEIIWRKRPMIVQRFAAFGVSEVE